MKKLLSFISKHKPLILLIIAATALGYALQFVEEPLAWLTVYEKE
ncbi:MAG: hypothetical protein PV362_12020 [Providencia heimbachae]|nr:hypothetical protein [Providencia heimbachae]